MLLTYSISLNNKMKHFEEKHAKLLELYMSSISF